MRVHPSQLSNGFFPLSGPSNFWVKSFNLNNKKIVFPLCVLFLISVLGTALTSKSVNNIRNNLMSFSNSGHVSEPLAVVLSNARGKILLLSAPQAQSSDSTISEAVFSDVELSITDKIFLQEALKFGTLSIMPLSDAAELPLLTSRSVNELKELLKFEVTVAAAVEPTVLYDITSRVFIPGQAEIFGIATDGKVVEIGANGKIVESLVE